MPTLPERDLVRRVAGCLFFGAFTARHVALYHGYQNGVLWWAELAMGVAFTIVYLVRLPGGVRAHGLVEQVLPYAGLICPLALFLLPVRAPGPVPWGVWAAIYGGLLVEGLGLAALWSLFSIAIEFRSLVDRGVYAVVRHPIYAGQILLTGGLAWFHPVRPRSHWWVSSLAFRPDGRFWRSDCWKPAPTGTEPIDNGPGCSGHGYVARIPLIR